jgi:hypothetical protein
VFSLFGYGGQAFAATGGSSLSSWFYAETGESGFGRGTGTAEQITATEWQALDSFFATDVPANIATFDYYHVFDRRTYYSGGSVTGGYDLHFLVRVNKSYNAKPQRADERLVFLNASLDKVPYQYLMYTKVHVNFNIPPAWESLSANQGLYFLNTADQGDITIFEKVTATTRYDPANPPGYSQPGYSEPDQPPENPNGPTDPDFPVQPTPPDNNWDLIGWLKYLVDWVIYLVKCFVYFIKSFGTAIADVVAGSSSLITAMTDFFAFLPNQVTTIIGMGIVAMIIVGIVKR